MLAAVAGYDLVVLNGTVVSPAGEWALDVGVRGETIAALGEPGSLGTEAARVIDASGCLVIPGGVDPHCHYSMTFEHVLTTEQQEFSPAAAFGGTTTLVDFAFVEGGASLVDAVAAKKDEAASRMAVDYGLHAILCGDVSFENIEQIGDAIRGGIATIKTFTTYGYMTGDGRRFGIMQAVAEHGGMSVVHAEDDDIANFLTARYVREGKTHGAYISEVRNSLVEEAAVRRCLLLAERSGSPLYILHMAAGAGIRALAEARERGLPVYGETLPVYLSFTQEDLWDDTEVEIEGHRYPYRGLLHNNYPTIKTAADREECWRALADGRLHTVGSDHALISVRDRFVTMGCELPFVQAGQASVELRLPLVFDRGVRTGRMSASRWVEVVATNPAKLMGLWPRKGELLEGGDADIVVFDPARTWTVDWRETLHMSAEYSIWQGWELQGAVRDTILRGRVLVEDGAWAAAASRTDGRFLPRRILPEVARSAAQPAGVVV
jgi:dihydropyrimidinase